MLYNTVRVYIFYDFCRGTHTVYTVKNAGCNSLHYESFNIETDRSLGDYTLMYIKTKTHFTIDGVDKPADPGTVIIFDKEHRHAYVNCIGYYLDDWMHFDSTEPLADSMLNRFLYLGGAVKIDLYIRLICDTHFRGAGKYITSQLIGVMLEDIRSATDGTYGNLGGIAPLLELRKKIYANPGQSWTVERMSKSVMMSAPYFQSRYKSAFGVSPVADVISIRIETAKALLAGSSLPVSVIAERCGYRSNVYFSRQFHAVVGVSPTQYRVSAQ